MAVRDRLIGLSAETERTITGLHDAYLAGDLSESRFIEAAAGAIARGERRAVVTADRAAAVQLTRLLGRRVAPVGDDRPESERKPNRLRDAVGAVLAARPDSASGDALSGSQRTRLGRLARAEIKRAGQRTLGRRLRSSGVGWTRATGDDPCPLCTEWADGVVRPASVEMATHPDCSCVQRPSR